MRIAGPAHRRPGSSRVKRRHVVSWCIIAVMVATVLVQWSISTINGASAERSNTWAGPPPGTWRPSVAAPTVTVTPTPTRSKRPATPTPAETPHVVRPIHKTKSHRPRTGPPTARIAAPSPGTRVAGQEGVRMTGTAAHLGGRKLEVFDYAPNGVYYLASDGGPVPVSGGHWTFQDATIGNGDTDVGKSFVLTVVIADGKCQATIGSTPRDAQNNIAYSSLPSGCRAADSVRVTKTAP